MSSGNRFLFTDWTQHGRQNCHVADPETPGTGLTAGRRRIAPVAYSHAYNQLIDPILGLKLDQMDSRSAVDKVLQRDIPDTLLRNFLLQNLERKAGHWRWKVNWPAIDRQMHHLTGFPVLPPAWKIGTQTRFIRGEQSDYIGAAEESEIAVHFKDASIETIANAGHWLHAEQPKIFSQITLNFLLQLSSPHT